MKNLLNILINENMKPKKLIRKFIVDKLKQGEWEVITDQDELNKLYALKIREELVEIQASEHKDISEFADLISVAFSFAQENGFDYDDLMSEIMAKAADKGRFSRIALTNLNPSNPSNALYFEYKKTQVQYQTFLKESIKILLNSERSIVKHGLVRITLDEDYKCSNADLCKYKIEYEYPLHLIRFGKDLHRAELKLSDSVKKRWFIP